MHVPFAFSISHFVSSVGADAGFAAIIGLAVLVLLYFAQARETSTLREEATAASQRVGELERRMSQLGQPVPAPAPKGATARTVANPVAAAVAGAGSAAGHGATARSGGPAVAARGAALPAAPAGVGAPALFDATRLIPLPAPRREGVAPVSASVESASEATAAPPATAALLAKAGELATTAESATAAETATAGRPPAADRQRAPAVPASAHAAAPAVEPAVATALATPPPATAAGGAKPVAKAPSTASNGTGEQHASAPSSPPGPPPRIQIRPGGSIPPRSLSLGAGRRERRGRRWLPALVGVLIVGAIVAALLVVTSTGSSPRPAAPSNSTNAPISNPNRATAFRPATVTVAVLNGTDVFQLAHRVAQKLGRSGFREGIVATATDQTHTATIIGYLPGDRGDAVRIARTLGLAPSAVQPVDQTAKTVACPPPAGCGAKVIITVGSDLSHTQ